VKDLLHPTADLPQPATERQPLEPEIHDLPPRETAVVAVDVPQAGLAEAIGRAIGEVESAMEEAGVTLAGPPFARYLAFGERIQAEVGFPVRRTAPVVGRVLPSHLPGGRVASIVHLGPYDGLHATYARLTQWLEERGLRPMGPLWEVYWSDPSDEPDPATWRTEISAPVG
jgi:effector-binding domain-containing protein